MSSSDGTLPRRDVLKGVGALTATALLHGTGVARAADAPANDGVKQPAAAPSAGAPAAKPAAASAQPAAGLTPGRIRFGITTPPEASFADATALWQEADRLGFDSAFVFDHPMTHKFEAWTLLAALATQTRRIKLGVLVTGNGYRPPAIVVKMATTVDHVSGGRAILGIGAAWLEEEFTGYGIPFYDKSERAQRLAEAVEIAHLLFTQKKVDYDGKFYDLKGGFLEPKPVQKPLPILVGGVGPKVVQPAAARHAQIWHFMVPGNPPDQVKATCEQFDAICREVGRDPKDVEKASSLNPGAMLLTPAPKVIEEIRMMEAAGVRHLTLMPPISIDSIKKFAEQVLPEFRKGDAASAPKV